MTTVQYNVTRESGVFPYTYDTLDNVTSISITEGRREIQDPFKANTAVITGLNPDDLPNVQIGDRFFIEYVTPSATKYLYFGLVANVEINYGMVTNMDTWTIQLEDGIARAGRAYTSSAFSWAAGLRTDIAAFQAANDCGIDLFTEFVTTGFVSQGQSFVSAQSLPNQNLLDILNQLVFTEQGRIVGSGYDRIGWVNRDVLGKFINPATFTDGTLTAASPEIKFESINFRALSNSYADSVLIEPQGLTAQLAGTTDRRFVKASYDQTTAQAKDLAEYVLTTLDVNAAAPFQISAVSSSQSNYALWDLAYTATIAAKCQLILRGNLYNLFVNGFTLTATPDQTRITFDMVSSEALNFFILDNTNFGVLDSNRLGF